MRLAALNSYPIKGCYRVDHDVAQVEPWGLAGDRRWLVVDPEGHQITQRDVARLGQVRPVPVPGGLVLTACDLPDLHVPEPREGTPVDAYIWRTAYTATLAGPAADDWFSKALNRDVRLVWLENPTQRPVEPEYGLPSDRVSFADAYPLLLATTASLDALNGWLLEAGSSEGPLPVTRFRPNVVVTGSGPWEEDGWIGRRIRIGEVTFRAPKPCDRCVVTTTDQETGERGHEPLRTLAVHRKVGQKLMFGVNLIPDQTGCLRVGDEVKII